MAGAGAGFNLEELPGLSLAELPDFTLTPADFTLTHADFAEFCGNGRAAVLDPWWDGNDPCEQGGD